MNRTVLDSHRHAYSDRFKYHGEDSASLSWYARRVVLSFRASCYGSLLSLGIGRGIVSRMLARDLADKLNHYLIVEGSRAIIEEYLADDPPSPRVEFVNSWFEEFHTCQRFDAIEMGFVLEHVDNPRFVLERFRCFLRPGGTLFVAVPNAKSLHRRIGHAAGLLDDFYRLSPQDLELGHQRYLDLPALTHMVTSAGFTVVMTEGIMLKPITTSQLEALELSPSVVEAFFEVGVAYPDLCNAILLQATL